MTKKWAVGVDLGGTKIEIARIDDTGETLDRLKIDTSTNGPAAVEEQIITAIQGLIKKSGKIPSGIGVGVAGQVENKTGLVRFAPNLKWKNYPLQENLVRALQLPVYVTNDVRAATWGEWLYGAGKGCDDLICLFVGTGIGSGVVSGGKMLVGCSNTAGEVGHMTLDLYGPLCTCGNRGCYEALGGGWAIARKAKEALISQPGKKLLQTADGDENKISAKTVIHASREGDATAVAIIEEAKKAIIAGAVSLTNIFNPCRLIVGGGVIEGLPELIDEIEEGIRQRALKAATKNIEVLKALLGNHAGVTGAAAMAMKSGSDN